MTDDAAAVTPPLLARAAEARWRTTIRGVVVDGPAGDEPVLVTAPGDLIWELLATPMRRTDLVSILAREFDVDADTVERDISPLLQSLLTSGALVEQAD